LFLHKEKFYANSFDDSIDRAYMIIDYLECSTNDFLLQNPEEKARPANENYEYELQTFKEERSFAKLDRGSTVFAKESELYNYDGKRYQEMADEVRAYYGLPPLYLHEITNEDKKELIKKRNHRYPVGTAVMILPDLSINVELPKCEEPGFVIGYTENSVSLLPHKKVRLLKEGYEYEICSVETDCGDFSLGEPRFYK